MQNNALNKTYLIALMATALCISVVPVQAAVIEAEGVAAIKPAGIERARQMAIQDAKDQASMQAGVTVSVQSLVESRGIPLESSRVRSTVRIGKVTVDREWQVGDNFHVRISANTEQSDHFTAASQKYRKKITATPFSIRKSYQANDIDDLSSGFPRELLRRLEDRNEFLTTNSQYILATDKTNPKQNNNSSVIYLAALYDSQFVISGEILDAGSSDDGGYFGFFKNNKRRFEVEFFVHDGLTGSLISRHRNDEFIEGEIAVGREIPFASKSFFSTGFGQAISRSIDAVVELISKDLAHVPFAAKVIRIADGEVYINAGGTSFIAPGDKLVAYHKKRELSMSGFGSADAYGSIETPVATVSVIQVQPMFSIGTLLPSAENPMIEVGDLVRFDFAGQSKN